MKKFSTLFIAALLLAGWSSGCADYLNTVPVDKSSPNTFLKGVEQAKSMLAGIYYCFYDDSPAYITPYTYENMCDNSYNHHTWEFSAEFASGTQTAASWWAELKWTKDWQAISRANSLIRSMALATGIGPADSRKILAEARFLRAWFYFDLVRFYGRVPLVDENSPQENAPREELDKVMAFIKGDVEYAVGNLDNIPGGEVASLGAALMLRLQIAQYEYDNAEVIACAKAIKELGYDLYGDFRKLFLDEGINDPSNKEVIFKVNYAEDLRSSYMTQLWYNWFSFNTTLEMVNSFFTANGLPVKPLEADNGASIPADPTYDKDYPFENRDPRLKLSVLCPGDEYRCDGTSRYQVHWQPANWDNKTGFAAKKGANETLGNLNNDGGDKILMRYGEVLLAWAEAENEENGPKGAYEMIDRLRRRVGMVTLTESLPNLTKETMRALIRNERRVELFHEGQRWHDIRRWKIAEKVMTDAHGLDVSKLQYYPSSGATSPYWQYEEIIIDKRSFNKDRDYLWPIPLKELNANPLIRDDQNPGY